MKKDIIQAPKGMHDLYKENAEIFLKLSEEIYKFSNLFGFEYIRTPIIENEKIFTLSLGTTSDIVNKEMFYVKSKKRKEKFVLRPEGTAPIIRAYIQNGMYSFTQPVKLFYLAPMYRYEKPQAGRLREHYQWGLEILGSTDPISDVEIIQVFDRFFKKFKLKNYIFKINSLGCEDDRKKYKRDLKKYYRNKIKKLCEDCRRRFKENPLRLLDCKNPKDQEYKKNAPILTNYLCKNCEEHFEKVLEYLEELDINYELDNSIVRGFDYYSKTVFEIFFKDLNIAIGGGGRYDYLGKIFHKSMIGGVGGALGIERFMEVLRLNNIKLTYYKKPKVFVVQITDQAKFYALKIYDKLLRNNIYTAQNFVKGTLSSQLEIANKLGVKYSIIIGHQELGSKSVILKDMETGLQEIIPEDKLIEELKKRLK
ncbi:MAG: histidine--tRNA ligase [Minisyncoccia bacterium]